MVARKSYVAQSFGFMSVFKVGKALKCHSDAREGKEVSSPPGETTCFPRRLGDIFISLSQADSHLLLLIYFNLGDCLQVS